MNKFFTSAVQRYPETLNDSLITPISRVDAEIIEQILRLNVNFELKNILEQWKYLKDEEILSLLKNVSSPSKIGYLITLGGTIFNIKYIQTIDIEEDYSFLAGKMMYYIIINKSSPITRVTDIYTYRSIEYDNIEERDKDVKKIRKTMEKFGFGFLNEE